MSAKDFITPQYVSKELDKTNVKEMPILFQIIQIIFGKNRNYSNIWQII
jgi:hypothetical protein